MMSTEYGNVQHTTNALLLGLAYFEFKTRDQRSERFYSPLDEEICTHRLH